MSLDGKGKALLDWVQGWDDLVKLNAIVTEKEGLALNVEPNSAPLETFIDGSKRLALTIVLSGMMPYSSFHDDVNAQAFDLMARWHDWIDAQYELGNLPDWEGATIEEISPISTAPTLAMVYDQTLAKYQFTAQIVYVE